MKNLQFDKLLELSVFQNDIFTLGYDLSIGQKILKVCLLILFAPIYVIQSIVVMGMYYSCQLCAAPGRLVRNLAENNAGEKGTKENGAFIIMYLMVAPFELAVILQTWTISLLSFGLDVIGNILTLGKRGLKAYNLCFNNEDGDKEGMTHVWLAVAFVAILGALLGILILSGLPMKLATSYKTVNSVVVPEVNMELMNFLNILFGIISYVTPTVVLMSIYRMNGNLQWKLSTLRKKQKIEKGEITEKTCPNCGTPIEDDMDFCGSCGFKLK